MVSSDRAAVGVGVALGAQADSMVVAITRIASTIDNFLFIIFSLVMVVGFEINLHTGQSQEHKLMGTSLK
jgi:hypothetical protein